MKSIIKYTFFVSGIIVILVFIINIVFSLTNPDFSAEYLVSSGKSNEKSFTEYINQEGKVIVKSQYSYFKEIDEAGIVFTKIKRYKENNFLILGYNTGQNKLFEFDISGNLITQKTIERGNVRFYD